MQFVALWQRPALERWEGRLVKAGDDPAPGAYFDRHERIVAVEPPGPPLPDGPFALVSREIMAYRAFPPRIGTPITTRTPVQEGDTVGLLYPLLPLVRIFFASRVTAVIDEPCRRGFVYRTLEGHPELGEETFSVVKNPETGEVRVIIFAWSVPNLWFVRMVRPLARLLQLSAGRAALDHLEVLVRLGRTTAPP